MRRDLDLALLRAFLAVVETGSVTGAARLLNRTQAAVSLQIKRLEENLGQQLFERDHKRLALAPQGEQLIGHPARLAFGGRHRHQRRRLAARAHGVQLFLELVSVVGDRGVGQLEDGWCRSVVGLEPEDLALGVAFGKRAMVDLDVSIEHWKRARRLSPDDPLVHRNVGIAFFTKGLLEEAAEAFRRALALDPGDSAARKFLRYAESRKKSG